MINIIDRSRLRANTERVTLFDNIVSRGDLCFDIGANIGDYTQSLLAVGAKVVSVDPQPSCIKELQARFTNDNNLVISPHAVGSKEANVDFYIRDHHGASSLNPDWEKGISKKITVPMITLKQLIDIEGRPKYIKIDAEGHELDALSTLDCKIDVISVEYHLTDEDMRQKQECIHMLEKFGSVSLNLVTNNAGKFHFENNVDKSELWKLLNGPPTELLKEFYGEIFIWTE